MQNFWSAVSRPFRQRNERTFTVVMYEDDYKELCSWVLKKPNIETGGDLFGLWKDKYTAVVQLVLGPGEKCRRSSVSFYQDLAYLKRVGSYLTDKEGLCHIGEWHSHHTLGLARPSGGDENTVWSNMPTYRLQRFFIFIANISHTTSESLVNVGCFLFELEDGNEKPVLQGRFEILHGPSPMRSSGEIMKQVHAQEESRNSDSEMREQTLHGVEDGHPTVAVVRRKRKAQPYTASVPQRKGKGKKSKGQQQQTKKCGGQQYDHLGAQTSKDDHERDGEESESSTSEEEESDGPQTGNGPACGTATHKGTVSHNQESDQNRAPDNPPEGGGSSAGPQTDNEPADDSKAHEGAGSRNQERVQNHAPDNAPEGQTTAADTENHEKQESTGAGEQGRDGELVQENQAKGGKTALPTTEKQGTALENQTDSGKDEANKLKEKDKERAADTTRSAADTTVPEDQEEGEEITASKQEDNGETGNDCTASAKQGHEKTAAGKEGCEETIQENNPAPLVDQPGNGDKTMSDTTGNQGGNEKTAESKGEAAEIKPEQEGNAPTAPVDQGGNDKTTPNTTGNQRANGNQENNKPQSGEEKRTAQQDERVDDNKTVEDKQDSTENGSITLNKEEEDGNTAEGKQRVQQESASNKTESAGRSTPKNQLAGDEQSGAGAQGDTQIAPGTAEESSSVSEDHQGGQITAGGGGYQETKPESTSTARTAAPENGKRDPADPDENGLTSLEGPEHKDEKTTPADKDKRGKEVVTDQTDEGGEMAHVDTKL